MGLISRVSSRTYRFNSHTMETIVQNTVKDQVANAFSSGSDTSGQPWYWRWGVAALGLIGGVIMFFKGFGSLITAAILTAAFEATALAKGFNWAFCQALVGVAEKVSPLMRTICYGGLSIVIIIVGGIGGLFSCIPALACAAAYFLLFLDQRNGGASDTSPVVENTDDGFA